MVLTVSSRAASEIDELFERQIPAWRWSKTTTAIEEQTCVAVCKREAGAVREAV